MKKSGLLVLLFVFYILYSPVVLASLAISAGAGGGGGGNAVQTNMGQSFSSSGMSFYASANNEGKTGYAGFGGYVKQGIGGRYYQGQSVSMSFNTDQQDPSEFYFNFSLGLLIVEEKDYVPNLNIGMYQNNNINAFGVSLYGYSELRNHTEWEYKGSQWVPVVTGGIEIYSYLNLKPAEIKRINLSLNENEYGENGAIKIFSAVCSGSGSFIAATKDEADALGIAFCPPSVPEPATTLLLGLGAMILRIRRR
jgi:hypothetical protein